MNKTEDPSLASVAVSHPREGPVRRLPAGTALHARARSQVARQASGRAVTTMVRESHFVGQCSLLGDLIDETCTRYVYRRRFGDTLALVDKRSPKIHVVPCKTCPDYSSSSADWLKFKPTVA